MTEFVDLIHPLEATADKHRDLPPHELARKFTLDEGKTQGDFEVIAVIDKNNQFLGAGTSHKPDYVGIPPAAVPLLHDPKAELVVHHNHPTGQPAVFSPLDIGAIGGHRGIKWLLMHTEDGYAAIRANDRLFQPEPNGKGLPIDGLTTAFKAGVQIAQLAIYRKNLAIDADDLERAAPELALQALKRVGAIDYHTSLKPVVGPEYGNEIVAQIIRESIASPERTGGLAIWGGQASGALSGPPGGNAGDQRSSALSDPSAIQAKFDFFLDLLSRPDAAATDPTATGRPSLTDVPDASGKDSGLASQRPGGRPVLESGLKPRFHK